MLIQIIKLKSALKEKDLIKKAKEREPQFKAIPGLLQKYYVKTGEQGQFGGIYVWDSPESLKSFQKSDLAASISKAYEVTESPDIEILDVLFQLRE